MSALNALISEAVDLVIHCARTPIGLRVTEIIAVEEQQTITDGTAFTVTELFRRPRPDADLCWTGNIPVRLQRLVESAGIDLLPILASAPPWPSGQRLSGPLLGPIHHVVGRLPEEGSR